MTPPLPDPARSPAVVEALARAGELVQQPATVPIRVDDLDALLGLVRSLDEERRTLAEMLHRGG